MTWFNFDSWNYAIPHLTLSFVGAFLTMWVMQLVSVGHIGRTDVPVLRLFRRLSLAVIGGGMLWSLDYGFERDWQPWPPFLVILLGIDMMLLMSVLGYYLKCYGRSESASTSASIIQGVERR